MLMIRVLGFHGLGIFNLPEYVEWVYADNSISVLRSNVSCCCMKSNYGVPI